MSRFWVTLIAVGLVFHGLAILGGGIASGRWGLGVVFAVVAVIATVEWLMLRKSAESAQAVADRMILSTLGALFGAALFALKVG
jgi:hypothetical protein